jgi:intergrase/recombinase
MIVVLPTPMGKIVKFGVLVGLRSSEIIESVRFINDKEAFAKYYDVDNMTLNHWKMPGMIRTTKKEFVSFITPEMLDIVQGLSSVPTLNAITLTCRRRGVKMNMHLTRKIFASHLRQSGIQSEFVNLLQGRVDDRDILTRHYLVPSSSLRDQVLQAVSDLAKLL